MASIDRQIGQLVGPLVLLAGNVANVPAGGFQQQKLNLLVEPGELGTLYTVLASDLPHEQLAVGVDRDRLLAVTLGALEGANQGVVFGSVVRLTAEVVSTFVNQRSVVGADRYASAS